MKDEDQHIKLLLQAFFPQFLEAFVSELHCDLNPQTVQFLDKELSRLHGALRQGRIVDLVARVQFRDGDGFVLVHIEHQARRESKVRARLLFYAVRLMERYGLPVYPILLTTYAQPRTPEPDVYVVNVRGFRVLEFHFRVVQLNRLDWREFIRKPNPAVAALLGRMNIAPRDRVKVKLQVLRLLVTFRLDRDKMDLIAGLMDQYLDLNAAEELAFARELHKLEDNEQKERVMKLLTSWERKGLEKGLQAGMEKGLEKGTRLGTLATVKHQLKRKVGSIRPELERQLEHLSRARLTALSAALLKFSGPQDLERWLSRRRS